MVDLVNSDKYIKSRLDKLVFVMDKSSLHTSDQHKSLFEKMNHVILSPLSSDMNPIELLFNQVKRKLMHDELEPKFD